MNSSQNFADVNTARDIAHNLHPNAQSIAMIEHSADNVVALVDTKCALRFPKNKNAYDRGLYERRILKQLEDIQIVTIPRVLGENINPPYVVTSYVAGRHVTPDKIRKFSEEQQQDFSKSVARFAYIMHTSFEIDKELPIREMLRLDEHKDNEPWPVYYKKVVRDGNFSTATQNGIAKRCYEDWAKISNVAPTVVVHDDLHTENMMFDNDNHLVGILDFGDTNVGTPEQELRQLYRISEDVMMAAVQEYQRLSGLQLDVDAIKIWAIMKELADYSKRLEANDTSHHSFKRASCNLNIWLPDGEWGKGYDLSGYEGFQ